MRRWWERKSHLLTRLPVFHTFIVAIKEFSIEQLDRDDSEYEVKEKIDNENVEHIFQRVDDAVKHGLQFGDSLDSLERPEHPEDPQWLDHSKVLSPGGSSTVKELSYLVLRCVRITILCMAQVYQTLRKCKQLFNHFQVCRSFLTQLIYFSTGACPALSYSHLPLFCSSLERNDLKFPIRFPWNLHIEVLKDVC